MNITHVDHSKVSAIKKLGIKMSKKQPTFRYKKVPPSFLKLDDMVIIYNDGILNKIIPAKYMLIYPVIYEKYYDKRDIKNYKKIEKDITGTIHSGLDNIYEDGNYGMHITITHCPYTKATLLYFKELFLTDYLYKGNIVLGHTKKKESEEFTFMVQLNAETYSCKEKEILDESTWNYIGVNNRRVGLRIMTLKNALIIHPDAIYMEVVNNKVKKIEKNIKKIDDATNKIIYGIEYNSYNSANISSKKYTAIVGKYKKIKGKKIIKKLYDYKKMGYGKYFYEHADEVINTSGTIIPCYLDAWKLFFPTTKVIKLKNGKK